MSNLNSAPEPLPYQVWYWRPEFSFEAFSGELRPNPQRLERTHVHLTDLKLPAAADALAVIYQQMQGECWSPNGEARPIIEKLALSHTSMSLGDLIVDPEGHIHRVAAIGFERVDA